MTEQTKNAQTPISNDERFKSLKNGEILKLTRSEAFSFLKYVEMTNPNFSMKLKSIDGLINIKI